MNKELSPSEVQTVGRLVRRCMNSLNVPAVAVGIVAGDRVLLAKGYGIADRRRGIPATKDTLFYVGSCTKAFTATSIGLLDDEGSTVTSVGLAEPFRRQAVARTTGTAEDASSSVAGM